MTASRSAGEIAYCLLECSHTDTLRRQAAESGISADAIIEVADSAR